MLAVAFFERHSVQMYPNVSILALWCGLLKFIVYVVTCYVFKMFDFYM
jgi:hypothetical protein